MASHQPPNQQPPSGQEQQPSLVSNAASSSFYFFGSLLSYIGFGSGNGNESSDNNANSSNGNSSNASTAAVSGSKSGTSGSKSPQLGKKQQQQASKTPKESNGINNSNKNKTATAATTTTKQLKKESSVKAPMLSLAAVQGRTSGLLKMSIGHDTKSSKDESFSTSRTSQLSSDSKPRTSAGLKAQYGAVAANRLSLSLERSDSKQIDSPSLAAVDEKASIQPRSSKQLKHKSLADGLFDRYWRMSDVLCEFDIKLGFAIRIAIIMDIAREMKVAHDKECAIGDITLETVIINDKINGRIQDNEKIIRSSTSSPFAARDILGFGLIALQIWIHKNLFIKEEQASKRDTALFSEYEKICTL